MIEYIKSFEFSSMIAIIVYWIPAFICALVYVVRAFVAYKRDLNCCDDKFYRPSLTVGTIAWGLLLTVTPAVNLLALVFDCSSHVFKFLSTALDIPLVRKRNQKGVDDE